jgi:molybdopterin-containing oxidoreductase family iron-sulfur binding subunit
MPKSRDRSYEDFIWAEATRPELDRLTGNQQFWRSLEDLDGSKLVDSCEDEHSGPPDSARVNRRALLRFMAASTVLGGLSGCAVNRQPWGAPLLSHPRLSAQHTPGVPLEFATSLELEGLGRGVLVKSHDGRPVKIEGNPLHPASLGATDVFAQAEVLSLYDPDRSRAPMAGGLRRSWADVGRLFTHIEDQFRESKGRGLHILLQPRASPTRDRLIAQVQHVFPEARWYVYSPLASETVRDAVADVFGRPVDPVFDLTQADVILTFGGDLLGQGPAHVRYAADYAQRRRTPDRPLPRLYSVETTPSLTGARADRRLAVPPAQAEIIARQIFFRVRQRERSPPQSKTFVDFIAGEIARAGPRSLIFAGDEQPSVVQAIAHALNADLGAVGRTVRYIEPLTPDAAYAQPLMSLAEAIVEGQVEALLILGGNPAYDAPGGLEFAELIGRVPLSVHLGYWFDETSKVSLWHIPARHALESWGDLRAFDGTVGLCQPATVPLFEAMTAEEVLARIVGINEPDFALVQATWREAWNESFGSRWLSALEAGIVANSASPSVPVAAVPNWSPKQPQIAKSLGNPTVVFAPDPSVWDGRFANNGWLQELPKPLTKQVWGNAALMAPATAAAYRLRTGDIAVFSKGELSIEAPVWLLPGHAPNAITLPLGYGRRNAGMIGDLHGFDAYRLRSSKHPWILKDVIVEATGRSKELITTQHHHRMEGRNIVQVVAPGEAAKATKPAGASLYPSYIYDGNAWGMTIDLDLCLGCNACVIACQAENNVPVVGPEEVSRGREMHWLRIDRYYRGGSDEPETFFQPVLCMHCEKAPCEIVCPVNATVHSSEGLNQMVYSRCVGTRTCSNNCPYKVRRFNWFNYHQRAPKTPDEVHNPDVTARWRGVIEKCTYCVQRISAARIAARMDKRPIRDGDVVTACQQACPTRAIVFGDINDPSSEVRRRKEDPRSYALLGELNTEPRTTYLARISDPLYARADNGSPIDNDDTG